MSLLLSGCGPGQLPAATLTPGPTSAPAPTSGPAPTRTPTVPIIPPPTLEPFGIVGQVGGSTQAVAVAGKHAYVGVGLRLVVLDISDPGALREIGSSEPLGSEVKGVSVAGETAFVAAGDAGLYIVDISDPARPRVIGHYDTPGYSEGVAVAGMYAYVADGPAGLRMVEFTDPAHPVEVSTAYKTNYVFDVAIDGGYAYAAAAGAGLLVADVSDPLHPKETGSLAMPGYAFGIAVSGRTVYVADGWDGLHIVDVSTPTQPKESGTFETRGWAFDVASAGSTAYVADAFSGLRIVDVSDAANPAELGSYDMPGDHLGSLVISGGTVYVASRNTGLGILDVSNAAKPTRVGFYNPLGYADAVAVSGPYAYVAAGQYGLRVVDISDLAHPREVGAYDTKAYATGVVVSGKRAYVITYGSTAVGAGLHVVDVSDPVHPTQSSFLVVQGMPQDIVIEKDIVYIADESGLESIDISDPASPVLLSALDFSNGDDAKATAATWGVAISNQMAYVTHQNFGLEVVDVSDPQAPDPVGTFKPASVRKTLAAAVGGDFAYVTDSPDLHIVDISDPKKPIEAGIYRLPVGAERVAFANDRLYVADSGGGLQVLDVSDPHHPSLAGWRRLPGYALGLSAADHYIYVADGEGGLFIIEDTLKTGQAEPSTFALSGVMEQEGKSSARSPGSATLQPISMLPPRQPIHDALVVLHFNGASSPAAGQTLTVTSTADSGPGTLREALEIAGKDASGAIITFDPAVFPPQKPAAIFLSTGLFLVGGNVTIDASNAGVVLDGSQAAPGTTGLGISSNHNSIQGLQIIHFPDNGMLVSGAFNTIGGDRSRGSGPLGEGNLISGNGFAGINILQSTAVGNRVIGNYIGTDLTGKRVMGNNVFGVSVDGASQNIIGGSTEGERNIISGNGRSEVGIKTQAHDNTITGNYIGTDAAGRVSLGNAWMGVAIETAGFDNIVQANVIGSNGTAGVLISDWGSWGNSVIGNYIGVDSTGTFSLGGTGQGIALNASFNRIGGTGPGERNIISGNGGWGIKIGWLGTTDVFVTGNYVGTDAAGTRAVGNKSAGIMVFESGAHHNFIGGPGQGERNLISGNLGSGISLEGIGTDDNFVSGNYLGTDASGKNALPNRGPGIDIKAGDRNFIQGNLIAYHQQGALTISSGDGNLVHHNSFIGNGRTFDGGNANRWDDGSEGNYWSTYRGIDQDGDGIGDISYPVPSNGADNHPLMKPAGG